LRVALATNVQPPTGSAIVSLVREQFLCA
jgi:hypothetical protein